MKDLVDEIRAGTWDPSHVRGDLASGNAVLDPIGDSVPAGHCQSKPIAPAFPAFSR